MNSYKETGIKNLPFINSNWSVFKVKNAFDISKELTSDENPNILSLARDSIKIRDISNNEGQIAASYDNYNNVKVGDLLLNPMDLYSGANCNVSYVEGVISPAYINLRSKKDIVSKFYDYYFKTQYWTMAMFAHGKGVSSDNRWTMNAETCLNYYLPKVSVEQQAKIVKFLDNKINKISELISIQESNINDFKKEKITIISSVTINGINCNNYYKKTKIKFETYCNISSLNDSSNIETINYVDIGSVDFYEGITNIELINYDEAPSRARRICKSGDVIISTVRTYLKAITDIQRDDLIVSTGFCVLTPKSTLNSKYLSYYCKSNYFTNLVSSNSYGISYPAINSTLLVNLDLVLPPLEEQIEIANYLDDKCSKIDELIKIKKQKIEELNSYKKSLIYEYVTGKKEV